MACQPQSAGEVAAAADCLEDYLQGVVQYSYSLNKGLCLQIIVYFSRGAVIELALFSVFFERLGVKELFNLLGV